MAITTVQNPLAPLTQGAAKPKVRCLWDGMSGKPKKKDILADIRSKFPKVSKDIMKELAETRPLLVASSVPNQASANMRTADEAVWKEASTRWGNFLAVTARAQHEGNRYFVY